MDPLNKLKVLGQAACYEPAEEVGPTGQSALSDMAARLKLDGLIYQAAMPGGRRITLLKSLLSSACENDCAYCAFRAGRDFRRLAFQPDELAALFNRLYQAGLVEGLFLSSGVTGGGVRTQDRLIDTAELIRGRYGIQGYLHLKIMPGAEYAQIERTMELADRVSVNLEAPTTESLSRLAPRKQLVEELVRPLRQVEQIRQRRGGKIGSWNNPLRCGPSQTTQFVVGPGGETDQELLRTTAYLRRTVRLARTYFSGFTPVSDTPLENHPPTTGLRQHRLYQGDFLLRDYGFGFEELVFDPSGQLPLDRDPKLAWAECHLAHAPLELNRAVRRELLRVPGIGPVGVGRILQARRQGRLRTLNDLSKLGIAARRAAPFILLDGRRPSYQLRFW
jgi:predicted DNA-binding helix-hairpin-helix protein